MPNQIYRIYDTIEKRHRDDMFVNTKGLLYEVVNGYELKSVFQEDRYIVERSTGRLDIKGNMIYQNDVYLSTRLIKGDVSYEGGMFRYNTYLGSGIGSEEVISNIEIIGHALRDSHLLEQ